MFLKSVLVEVGAEINMEIGSNVRYVHGSL